MTCASCANRIERKLSKLPGVEASVNYATEKAHVNVDGDIDPADLIAAVEAAGYRATLPVAAPATVGDDSESVDEDDTRPLRRRLIASAALTAPVVLLSMVSALQF